MTSDKVWIPAEWPVANGIVAGCTVRSGGVSSGVFASLNVGGHVGDHAENVAENRRRLIASCGLLREPVWLNQVHESAVVIDPRRDSAPEADAILSRQSGTVCAVQVADCLPVLFASEDGGEIAAAHAGWRGLCNGVLEATIGKFSSTPATLVAWLGPAISQQAFEVGGEVRDAFLQHDEDAADCFVKNSRGRWQADLYELARQRLSAAGVRSVSGGEYCTFGEADRFFSYRRDAQCGRMAAFVYRRP